MFHNDVDNPFEGIGVASVSRIMKGTEVLCHCRMTVSKATVRKTHGSVCSHLMNVDGTGCAIEGPHHILFNEEASDFNHEAPEPLMSSTNSL